MTYQLQKLFLYYENGETGFFYKHPQAGNELKTYED